MFLSFMLSNHRRYIHNIFTYILKKKGITQKKANKQENIKKSKRKRNKRFFFNLARGWINENIYFNFIYVKYRLSGDGKRGM